MELQKNLTNNNNKIDLIYVDTDTLLQDGEIIEIYKLLNEVQQGIITNIFTKSNSSIISSIIEFSSKSPKGLNVLKVKDRVGEFDLVSIEALSEDFRFYIDRDFYAMDLLDFRKLTSIKSNKFKEEFTYKYKNSIFLIISGQKSKNDCGISFSKNLIMTI